MSMFGFFPFFTFFVFHLFLKTIYHFSGRGLACSHLCQGPFSWKIAPNEENEQESNNPLFLSKSIINFICYSHELSPVICCGRNYWRFHQRPFVKRWLTLSNAWGQSWVLSCGVLLFVAIFWEGVWSFFVCGGFVAIWVREFSFVFWSGRRK